MDFCEESSQKSMKLGNSSTALRALPSVQHLEKEGSHRNPQFWIRFLARSAMPQVC